MNTLFVNQKIYLLALVCMFIANAAGAQLKAIFTVDTIGGCAPFTVKIKESSTGNPTQYSWDFGNGQTSTARTPVVTYTKPGVYTLTETITLGAEQSATFTTIYVHGVPATFTYNYTNICSTPADIKFFPDSINSTTKYYWDFGDKNKMIQPFANNTYTTNGKYNVQLITENAQGCKDTSVQHIQTGKGDADFVLPDFACVDQPMMLMNASLPLPKSTTWKIDNTTITGTNATYTFNRTGSYKITMDADFGTCKQSITKQVNVLASPKANFSEAGTLVSCTYPETITFTNKSINASSYLWIFGDGTTTNTPNATHTYTTAGMFNVSLVAINASGCTDTLTKKVLVRLGPPVISGFNNLPISGCIPVTAKPSANIISPEEIVSYDWDFGDGTHGYDAEPEHTYTEAGYYRVTLTVKTKSGCTGTYSMFQAVAGGAFPPIADFSVPDTDICGNEPVSFFASAKGTVTSWNWEFGDGSKSNVQNPVYHYSAPGSYTVTLYVSDKGCPANVQKKNYLSVKPPFAKILPVYHCEDRLRVDFIDQSIQPSSWEWDFGDGSFSNSQNVTHIYSKSGQYRVRLRTDNNGCANTTDTLISVIDFKPPITQMPASGITCRNDSIVLNTDSANYISEYLWNLADGTSITGKSNITYAYNKNGTYSPYLIVDYVNGCKDTNTVAKSIQVSGPTAGFKIPSAICINDAVSFVDTSFTDGVHPIKTWQWNDGESEVVQQNAASFSHTYTTGGTYVPTLKITDVSGCTDSVAVANPLIVNGAKAGFDYAEASSTCDTTVYAFTDQSSESVDAVTQYKWSFGDGGSAFVKDPRHAYTQSTSAANATLTVVTAEGCANTITKTIAVAITEAPKLEMKLPTVVCLNDSINFNVRQTGGNTTVTNWLWDFGDGVTNTEQNTVYSYTASATYDVKLIATASPSCTDTITQTIKVNALPAVNAGADIVVCAGNEANVTVTGAQKYTWYPVEDLSCTDCATPVASPAATTMYYVKGTDNNGCANTDSVLITVQQQSQLQVEKPNINLCNGDSVVLRASGGDVYTWQPATGLSNATIANPIAKPLTTTTYQVTATDKYRCFTTTEQVHIVVNNKPTFNIVDTLLTLNKGVTQQLQTNSSADVVNWSWQPRQNLSCYNCPAPVLTANMPVTYSATATNAVGCSATDIVRVAILCNATNLYVPTGFTPNGDGRNDHFIPLSSNGIVQKIRSFDIYTNTGQKIFSKQNIYTNSYADGWDGTFKGFAMGGNVFVYRIEIECNDKIVPFIGTVTLIR